LNKACGPGVHQDARIPVDGEGAATCARSANLERGFQTVYRDADHQPAVGPRAGSSSATDGDGPGGKPVENLGVFNGGKGAEDFGFRNLRRVYWNLEAPALYEQALSRGEAQLIKGGAIAADTGIHTGRSPRSGGRTMPPSRPSSSTRSSPIS
jgi:hypothetical protein